MSAVESRNHRAVKQIDDCTIISGHACRKLDVCKIGAPDLVDIFCFEFPVYQIFEHHVRFSKEGILHFLPTNDGFESQFHIQILSDGVSAAIYTFPGKQHADEPGAIIAVVLVICLYNLSANFLLSNLVVLLAMQQIIVIGVRASIEFPQKPSQAELWMIGLNKSINH